ncbi:hypothetical protein [Planctomycetes bacterium K23_9]|uniref:hypothetical protein n=1 Tax=Stieleria marina TaxID=1930275 RepID=UPI0011A8EBA2
MKFLGLILRDDFFAAETEDRSSGEGVTGQNAFELRDGEGSVDLVVKFIAGRWSLGRGRRRYPSSLAKGPR